MTLLREKYSPETLPYHIIVPSHPGFALSSDPPLDRDWQVADTARILHKLLLSIGFGSTGYLVQGGDIGSFFSRIMAATYSECKGMHLNFMLMTGIMDYATPEDQRRRKSRPAALQRLLRKRPCLCPNAQYQAIHYRACTC
jgi:microsomal epoxide hydrolase